MAIVAMRSSVGVVKWTRAMSFVQFGQDVAARWESLKHMVTDSKLALALVIRCWEKNDTRFALHVEKVTTIRLMDAWNAVTQHEAAMQAGAQEVAHV